MHSLEDPPQPLKDLFVVTTSKSKHFLSVIRKFNCAFQMTSFGGKIIKDGWMPTFKVQGQVYDRIGSLKPLPKEQPKFLQLYFVADYNEQTDRWISSHSTATEQDTASVENDILLGLQHMFHEKNSYVQSFQYALDTAATPNFNIIIDADKRPSGEHSGLYNAPSCNEVAIVLHGDQHNKRDIVIKCCDK